MKGRIIALEVTLVAFLALTGLVLVQHGYLGFFQLAFANTATELMAFDLVISLSLILVWMHGDARERGLAFWPFALVTLGFGAAGPLVYLIRREWKPSRSIAARPQEA